VKKRIRKGRRTRRTRRRRTKRRRRGGEIEGED
jgi:hypothetical protein